jgi:lambda repressor-like predicted transcriptional regulator
VLELLADAGVQMRRQPLSEVEIEAAARLYASGRSLSQMSAELGLAQSSLQLAFKRRGV